MARTPKSAPATGEAHTAPGGDSRRWWGLVVISMAQLLVVIDATIVNIALPSAQRDLGMSDADRQWVITAYTLSFGGLLLLGGRIADLAGRQRVFVVGLVGFALASAVGGAAPEPTVLFAARALQGVFAAALAPAALALLSTMFTDPRERSRAFGVYGALSGGGAAAGLLAGGVLTEYLDWRWCLYVNVPVALVSALGSGLLPRDRGASGPWRLDLPGALLGCGGLVALVYAFARAEHGWGDPLVLGLLLLGLLLLVGFTAVERRSAHPMLPLRVVADRGRGGSFLAVALSQVGLFGLFLFLTYYLQVILDYPPALTGVAFLPLAVGIGLGSSVIAARLLPHTQPRFLIVPALLVVALGMGLLTQLSPGAENIYLRLLLPAQILIGLGIGCAMMPAMSTATAGLAPDESGAAAAMVNSAQQVGGSLGLALLNTVSTSVTGGYLAAHGRSPDAVAAGTVHGYTVAIALSVGILAVTALLSWILINTRPAVDATGAPTDAGDGPRPAADGAS